MFIRFITSRLLRIIVCAAAGLYGLYVVIAVMGYIKWKGLAKKA